MMMKVKTKWILPAFALWLGGSVFGLTAAFSSAQYPSTRDLEADLHLASGQMLPKEVQGPDGRIFRVFYVRSKELPNGYYEVVVRLSP